MSVTVTAHGHATFTIDVDGTRLLIDPFLSGNPVAKVDADTLHPDYILITHGHGDHITDALPIAKRCDIPIIANFEICSWVNSQGHAKTHPQHIGGGFNHPFGRVQLTPALHGSGLPDGRYGGQPAGFLLSVGGKRIYVSGDTALFSDMSLIGRHGLDLAIVCIGDNFTMGPEDALLAVDFLKPTTVIPCHYNTWPLIEVDVDAWMAEVRAKTSAEPVRLDAEAQYTL